MESFVHVLSREAKARILAHLRRPRPLGMDDLDAIARAFTLDFDLPLDDGLVPYEKPADHVLSTQARIVLTSKTADYEDKQQIIMEKLDAMLTRRKR
jgi:hypothetical protein